MNGGEDDGDLMFVPHIADAREKGLNGREVVDFGSGLSHAGGVKVTDFLLAGCTRGNGGFVFLKDLTKDGSVPLLEDAAGAPAGLVGGNGISGVHPGTGILMEIDAGVDGGVDAGDVDVL
jgi:hypothetical protein